MLILILLLKGYGEKLSIIDAFRHGIDDYLLKPLKLAQDLKIINADPLQIEQVMMNLGVNARDAMPGDSETILLVDE